MNQFRQGSKNGINCMTEFTNRYESAMIVAAAGFMLKQENSVALAASLNSGMIQFMRKFSIFVLALVFSFNTFARESTLLDSGWKFKSGESTNAQQAGFDDSGWQAVSIPHNWGWQEAQQGKNYYRGPGWYRRELDISAGSGQTIFSAVRGGEPGGGCLFERQIAGRTSRRLRRILF